MFYMLLLFFLQEIHAYIYILENAWEICVKEVVSCILIRNLNHNLVDFGFYPNLNVLTF